MPIWMFVNEASPCSDDTSSSRSVAVAGVPLRPARITMLNGRPGTFTDWQRLDSEALVMPETATGWFLGSDGSGMPLGSVRPPFSWAKPPYWTNPLPSSWSAETLNCEPDTENDAAIAPLAIPKTMAPAATTAGTMIAANRRHLVRPCTTVPLLPCACFKVGAPPYGQTPSTRLGVVAGRAV